MAKHGALLVPGGYEVARLLFRKLEAEQRPTLPECLQRHVEECLGWCYAAHDFQKAIDAATSAQGRRRILILRSLTLTPLNFFCDEWTVYGVLSRGPLAIEALGGPWDVKLLRGASFPGAARALVLSNGGDCSLHVKNVAVRDSMCLNEEICMHLFFKEAGAEPRAAPPPRTLLEQVSCRSLRESSGTAALTCFDLLGRKLSEGDRLLARKSLCTQAKLIQAGCRGVVKEVRWDELGPLTSVEWDCAGGGQTPLRAHWNRCYLAVEATQRPPSSGSVSNGCIVSREGRIDGAQKGAEATPLPLVQTPSTVREPQSHAREELKGLATALSR